MRLIDADELKEGKVLIDEDILECESVHEVLVYLLEKIEEMIDEVPTVEPVRGEWIDTDFGVLCTNCRTVYDPFDIRPEEVEKFKFCPNCGADMRGEKNE